MNKSLLSFFAVPFLSLAISSLASAQLISNGGFETAFGNGTGNWGAFANASRETAAGNGVPAHGGLAEAKFFGPFSGHQDASGVFQNFTATAGQSFSAAGFGKNPSTDAMKAGNTAYLQLSFFTAAGSEILSAQRQSAVIDLNTPFDTWVPLSISSAIAPVGTDHGQMFILFLQTNAGTTAAPVYNGGAAYFDDLSLNLNPVPEPATFALLGLGIVPVLRRRRR